MTNLGLVVSRLKKLAIEALNLLRLLVDMLVFDLAALFIDLHDLLDLQVR